MTLKERVKTIEQLFVKMDGNQASNWQVEEVKIFKETHPELIEDLDFCFEVLAGKHKMGVTLGYPISTKNITPSDSLERLTIKQYYEATKKMFDCHGRTLERKTLEEKLLFGAGIISFMVPLINREYRLGYSNKSAMVTNLTPMLAKKYPDDHKEQYYYIQEKLDGNRCIAFYKENKWNFQSRSGKPLKVNFDMSWADTDITFDGEIMTLGKAGSRDFNQTSGSINSKYGDKTQLHYYIYDIIDENLPYEQRKNILECYDISKHCITKDCTILPVLDKIWVYPNPDYNCKLDEWLDKIVNKGGEGLILRNPEGLYEHKRTANLLKYKRVQTMDLKVIGIEEGNGKYEDKIGSLICTDDERTVLVKVGSGLSDEDRDLPEDYFIGKIVEVAYFDICQSEKKGYQSLRFPRLKGVRDDKSTTSKY